MGSYSPAFPPGVDILLLKNKCIAWGRGLCNRCEKVCPERAVLFIGGMNPRIMENRCTLCDLCVPACPENAILIREPEIENKETKDS
ncbi:MAG: hypothetical protein GY780_09650 [bacterium]|nr:hypothetical protein [bacterium]